MNYIWQGNDQCTIRVENPPQLEQRLVWHPQVLQHIPEKHDIESPFREARNRVPRVQVQDIYRLTVGTCSLRRNGDHLDTRYATTPFSPVPSHIPIRTSNI